MCLQCAEHPSPPHSLNQTPTGPRKTLLSSCNVLNVKKSIWKFYFFLMLTWHLTNNMPKAILSA